MAHIDMHTYTRDDVEEEEQTQVFAPRRVKMNRKYD